MKCRYCGKEIPEGALYCKACGREVFIVPEYNPLDDMLTEQIRDSIDGTGREEDYLVYDDASFRRAQHLHAEIRAGQQEREIPDGWTIPDEQEIPDGRLRLQRSKRDVRQRRESRNAVRKEERFC